MKKLAFVTGFFLAAVSLLSQPATYFFQTFEGESATTMCFDADSNIWLGCVRNDNPWLIKTDRNGVLLDQLPLSFPYANTAAPVDMLFDSDGMLVGCGTMAPRNPNLPECSYVFRFDPGTRQMLWCQRLVHGFPMLRGILEPQAGGPFIGYACNYNVTSVGDIFKIDRITGAVLASQNRTYRTGFSEDPRAAVYHNDHLYVIARSDLGQQNQTFNLLYNKQSVWKLDTVGFPVWALLGNSAVNHLSWLVGQDILVENDHLYSIYWGNETNSSDLSGYAFLQKTTLDGTVVWARKYDITSFGYQKDQAFNLVSTPDGFILLGNSGNQKDFLLKTDKDGRLKWARGLGTTLSFISDYGLEKPNTRMMEDGSALYLWTTTKTGPKNQLALIKTDFEGNIPGCSGLAPLFAQERPLADSSFFQLPLITANSPLTLPDLVVDIQEPEVVSPEKSCENEGPDPANPCLPPYYVRSIDAVLANSLTTWGDSTLIIAGEKGDSAMLTALNPDGVVLWSYGLAPMPGEQLSVTDILIDSDRMIAGAGLIKSAQGNTSRFAFRFDPFLRKWLWVSRFAAEKPETGGLLETRPGGAFLLYQTELLAGGNRAPTFMHLNRFTGLADTLAHYRLPTSGGEQSLGACVAAYPFVYGAGWRQSDGKSAHTVQKLFNSAGISSWNGLYDPEPNGTGNYGGADAIVLDQGKIVTAFIGNPDGDIKAPRRIYLQKSEPGGIFWTRYFELPSVTQIELAVVSGGYILLCKTGLAEYTVVKTNSIGSPLVFRKIKLGNYSGSGILVEKSQHRLGYSGKYLYMALNDDRPGITKSYLVKTDLNVDIPGSCHFLQTISVGHGELRQSSLTGNVQSIEFASVATLPLTVQADSAVLRLQPVCPPRYIEPDLDLGPDLSMCPTDTVCLMPGGDFKAFEWQDGSTDSVMAASQPGLYFLQATTLCNSLRYDTIVVSALSNPVRNHVIAAAPGVGVVLGGATYFVPDTVVLTVPSAGGFCDTLDVFTLAPCPTLIDSQMLDFYPGQSVNIYGTNYDLPGVYTFTFQTAYGCDSIKVYRLAWIITDLQLKCPPDVMDTAAVGEMDKIASYDLPQFYTTCPDSSVVLTLLNGHPSGSSFPIGVTPVCYEAANACGIRDTCCFEVGVISGMPPCDEKSAGPCIQVALIDIRFDANGRKRYRLRVTNDCQTALDYLSVGLPSGVSAQSPANGAIFEAASGNTYVVRNPSHSPVHSIRFRATTSNLADGASEIFEYSLPQQSAPGYIYLYFRFADQSGSEAHLSSLSCPILPWSSSGSRSFAAENERVIPMLWPNPAEDRLHLNLAKWEGQTVRFQILNAQGTVLLDDQVQADEAVHDLFLPSSLLGGLYCLTVYGTAGDFRTTWFVVNRMK